MLHLFITSLPKIVVKCLISFVFVFVGLHLFIGTTFPITCLLRQNLKCGSRRHWPDVTQIKCVIIEINVNLQHINFYLHQLNPLKHKVPAYVTTFNVQSHVKH